MRLVIESMDVTTSIDGVPVRLWRGTTEGGRTVDVFVHRIGSDDPAAQAELSAALREMPRPVELERIARRGIDPRHIL